MNLARFLVASLFFVSTKSNIMMKANIVYTRSLLLIFRGIGQVMFQENAFSGLLMWIGLCTASVEMALMALLGCCISTLTAVLLRYSTNDIQSGLYGFNGTLVGIATAVFLTFNPYSLAIAIIFSALSTWITHAWSSKRLNINIPAFTSPFILSTWGLLAFCHIFAPALLLPPSQNITATADIHWMEALSLGFGQIMFVGNNLWTGIFFLAGIIINSRLHALYAIWGVILPVLALLALERDHTLTNEGMWGYNAVLTAIALSGIKSKSFLWCTVGILISLSVQGIGLWLNLPTLTAPFVIATWLTTMLATRKNKDHEPKQHTNHPNRKSEKKRRAYPDTDKSMARICTGEP